MISSNIKNVHMALGTLLHKVDDEAASVIRLCRSDLMGTIEQAEELESVLLVPGPEPTCTQDGECPCSKTHAA
jgi:hypothetical protein